MEHTLKLSLQRRDEVGKLNHFQCFEDIRSRYALVLFGVGDIMRAEHRRISGENVERKDGMSYVAAEHTINASVIGHERKHAHQDS